MNECVVPGLPAGIVFDAQNEKLVGRLQECLAHPLAESFRENLERLTGLARGGSRVRIGLDFAQASKLIDRLKNGNGAHAGERR